MAEDKLYDIAANDFPKEVRSTFLATQVFRCPVCLSRTNRMEIRAEHHHRSPYPVCPHREEDWHVLLRGKLRQQSDFHPATYQAELKEEIDSLRENASDQLIGTPDVSSEKPFPATGLRLKEPKYD